MFWIYLLIAGLLETGWVCGLKFLSQKPGIALLIVTLGALAGSLGFLWLAMRSVPLGIAYPVWTAIGALGSVGAGSLLFGDPLSARSLAGLGLIVAGITCLSASHT